jgi:hypothetical protein
MIAPVLALAPMLIIGTAAGASTGPIGDHGHPNYSLGKTRMEKTGGQGRERLTAQPDCGCSLLPSCPGSGHHAWGGCQ